MYSKIIKNLRDLENGKKGLWINNLTLKKSLEVGDAINCIYDFENKVLIVEKAEILGNHTVSFRKSNPTVPILDIKNGSLTRLFQDVEKVEIQFYENKIVVKTALVEQKQIERESKEQLRTFELFCGGGTLSEHFKYAGFTPIGGLEFNENCLKFFEHNHTSSKITILSDIRDVQAEEYPKNVDVALCGIPCTTFTKSNKQMQEALSRHNNGESTDEDKILLESRYEAEYLTYYVLEAIRAMNPKTVVVEEVVEYSTTNAAELLRGILRHMNYEISETVSIGSHTARKRWCLVANAGSKVDLDNLITPTTKTLLEVIGKTVDEIEWKKVSEIQRLVAAEKKETIGIRSSLATETICNTITCHGTRHTEPSLKHPTKDLYYEFTNEDIKKIHGLHNYKLSGVKTWDRYILGNGVVDMFYQVALRIKEANKKTKFIAA
jgi:site-specific DNA-cytosine methylase